MEITEKSAEELDDEIEEESARKIEAALFIAGKYLTIQELVALTDVNPILLKKKLEDLKDAYKNGGIEILENNGLWKMDVSPTYVRMVNKMATGSSEFSKAEQETLAIIAYKQPMKQSVIVKIRGNKAYDHIRKFSELGLIVKKRLGHTWELTLSESFHDYFHVGENGESVEGLVAKDISDAESAGAGAENEKQEEKKADDAGA
ncbi:MAG: SMC-Scp complex subunit ScpB [Candidatus Nanoarchaeia archaeon]|nr:SMC-Scp complex subunit ScpB [Candidatus Nanoarchaeia archaeon]